MHALRENPPKCEKVECRDEKYHEMAKARFQYFLTNFLTIVFCRGMNQKLGKKIIFW